MQRELEKRARNLLDPGFFVVEPDHYEVRNYANTLKPSAGSGSMSTPKPVTVIRNSEVTISGIHRCCSAMNVCGINGYGQMAHYDKAYDKARPYKYSDELEWYKNFQRALDHYTKKANQYHIPWRLRYLPAMLKCYAKGSQGEGGQNMWAASYYATRTVFMVDRRGTQPNNDMSVHGFIDWLSKQRHIGKVAVGGYADGAHGGKCRGAVRRQRNQCRDIGKGQTSMQHRLRLFRQLMMM
jgi:hypothetical protein